MNKKDFTEECWFMYGIRLGKYFVGFMKYHSVGESHEVMFDYSKANNRWVVGWKHTHPGIRNIHPSPTDNKTMRSWVKSLYKPFLCGIACNGHEAFYRYRVNGLTKTNVTKVRSEKVRIEYMGPFFIAF